MPHCKICGKSFVAEKSVRAHIQSSTNGDHEGIGYSTADPHIASSSKDDPPESEKDSFDKSSENAPAENEDNPLTDEPEVENPQSNSQPNEEPNAGTVTVTCYECGGDVGTREEVRDAMQRGETTHAWCEHCNAPITV